MLARGEFTEILGPGGVITEYGMVGVQRVCANAFHREFQKKKSHKKIVFDLRAACSWRSRRSLWPARWLGGNSADCSAFVDSSAWHYLKFWPPARTSSKLTGRKRNSQHRSRFQMRLLLRKPRKKMSRQQKQIRLGLSAARLAQQKTHR